MQHKTLLVIVLTLLLFPFCNQAAFGENIPVGKLEKSQGGVIVIREDGKEVQGKPELHLYGGDCITTGKDGAVWFSLSDGAKFRLGNDSQMDIDEISSEAEDDMTHLRLVLGYLWSKIKTIGASRGKYNLHTPTAVMGVRGTEFDAIVSIDASSTVAVDEGIVDIEAEGGTVSLQQGKMSEIEFDGKPSTPVEAIAKEKRDWNRWREQKTDMFIRNLPRISPRFRNRFEQALSRTQTFTEKINQDAERLRDLIQELRDAKKRHDRGAFLEARKRLQEHSGQFKKLVGNFRKVSNRMRTMGGISIRMEKFVLENEDRFTEHDLTLIKADLAAISKIRPQMKDNFVSTRRNIKGAFMQLRRLSAEMKKDMQ
ncbi:MAG: hypothetical protein EHM85_17735 [Desulfobacteraceae bacterium]|nr:MAG: hypothetical protein EHM85_17735 [Desulfobacteraceae bacterium]